MYSKSTHYVCFILAFEDSFLKGIATKLNKYNL